jgi:RNA polymerase sigma-70 factor (ECF subfamily)
MHGDGGGKAPALARAVRGADRVGRMWANFAKQGIRVRATINPAIVNGQPGAVIRTTTGEVISVVSLAIAGGKVTEIHSIVNPDKLRHVGDVANVAELLREGSSPA